MDKVNLLQERAETLRELLEKYAEQDSDVEAVLRFMTPILTDIKAGKIVPPVREEHGWNFSNTESPLYRKYKDLHDAYVEYAWVLEERGGYFIP